MWPAPVVVCDPLLEKAPQVPLVERDQKIKAFAANRADQSLTERVRLGSLEGCLQYLQIHRLQTGLKRRSVPTYPLGKLEHVGRRIQHNFSRLRPGPGGCRVGSDVEV